jgi:hypothetical protein
VSRLGRLWSKIEGSNRANCDSSNQQFPDYGHNHLLHPASCRFVSIYDLIYDLVPCGLHNYCTSSHCKQKAPGSKENCPPGEECGPAAELNDGPTPPLPPWSELRLASSSDWFIVNRNSFKQHWRGSYTKSLGG